MTKKKRNPKLRGYRKGFECRPASLAFGAEDRASSRRAKLLDEYRYGDTEVTICKKGRGRYELRTDSRSEGEHLVGEYTTMEAAEAAALRLLEEG